MTEEIKVEDQKLEVKEAKKDQKSAAIGSITSRVDKIVAWIQKNHDVKFVAMAVASLFVLASTSFAANTIVDDKTSAKHGVYQLYWNDGTNMTLQVDNLIVSNITVRGNINAASTNMAAGFTLPAADISACTNFPTSGLQLGQSLTTLNAITATGAVSSKAATTVNTLTATGAVNSKVSFAANTITATGAVSCTAGTTVNTLNATGVVTFAVSPVLGVIQGNNGTNTAVWATNCPSALNNNQPTWFTITATNGSSYYVPAFLKP